MFKVGGIWVSPVEIENVLMEHESVNECAVVEQEIEGLIKPFAYVVPEGNVGSMRMTKRSHEKIFLNMRAARFQNSNVPEVCYW